MLFLCRVQASQEQLDRPDALASRDRSASPVNLELPVVREIQDRAARWVRRAPRVNRAPVEVPADLADLVRYVGLLLAIVSVSSCVV